MGKLLRERSGGEAMKVKISVTLVDEHCKSLLNEFGLETAEELKVEVAE